MQEISSGIHYEIKEPNFLDYKNNANTNEKLLGDDCNCFYGRT